MSRRLDDRVDEPRSAARYGFSNASRYSATSSGSLRPLLRIATAPAAPITAISALGHATQRSLPMPRESMTMYAPPYALRSTTQSRGTVAAE